jgi:hypothetical protein
MARTAARNFFRKQSSMLPNLIYDIGMHNGDDTAYYLSRGFNVLAVEANPKLAATATERFVEEKRHELSGWYL